MSGKGEACRIFLFPGLVFSAEDNEEEMKISNTVVLACGAPLNFCVKQDGAYESTKIQFGGAARLYFTKKETYTYEARSSKTFYESFSPVKRELKDSIAIT